MVAPLHKSALSQAALLLETAGRMAGREWRMAKAEVGENLSRAGVGAALLAIARLVGLVALFVLSDAAVAGLVAAGFAIWLAALMIAGGLSLSAIVLVLIGLPNLKAERLIPNRTLSNLHRDMEVLKEAVNA